MNHAVGVHRAAREQTGSLKIFDRIAAGGGKPQDAQLLLDICDNIEGKSFCALGDAAAWPIQSAIRQFPDDFKKWLTDKTGVGSVTPNV